MGLNFGGPSGISYSLKVSESHIFVNWSCHNKISQTRRLTQCCSVAQSCQPLCDPMDCSTPVFPFTITISQGLLKRICLLSRWCHPAILSSAIPFSPCLQSFPASGFFPMIPLFASGGHSVEASTSASVLPMNIQGWFPLGLAGLISLQSKGLSGIFSNTNVRKHQFFSTQPSLWSNSHIYIWLLEKP